MSKVYEIRTFSQAQWDLFTNLFTKRLNILIKKVIAHNLIKWKIKSNGKMHKGVDTYEYKGQRRRRRNYSIHCIRYLYVAPHSLMDVPSWYACRRPVILSAPWTSFWRAWGRKRGALQEAVGNARPILIVSRYHGRYILSGEEIVSHIYPTCVKYTHVMRFVDVSYRIVPKIWHPVAGREGCYYDPECDGRNNAQYYIVLVSVMIHIACSLRSLSRCISAL